jgi:AdoMet-dependent heme synthase
MKRIRIDNDGIIAQNEGSFTRIALDKTTVARLHRRPDEAIEVYRVQNQIKRGAFTENSEIALDVVVDATDFLSRPLRIYYGLEPRCDLACTFCGPRDLSNQSTPASGADEDFLLRNIADAGAFQIQLSGGEIAVRGQSLIHTIRRCADLGLEAILSTNGVWSCISDADRFIDDIQACGNVVQAKLSIEGTHELHDKVRGSGTYEKTISTLRKLSRHNIPTRVNATLTRDSCTPEQLEHLVGLAIRYHSTLQLIPLRPVGRAVSLFGEMPTREQLFEYTAMASDLRHRHDLQIKLNFDIFDRSRTQPDDLLDYRSRYDLHSAFSCGAPLVGLHVTHTGECYPCGFVQGHPEFMAGQITRDMSLLDIWLKSPVLAKLRNIEKPKACGSCDDYGSLCTGGCWVNSWATSGNLSTRDPYCIRPVYDARRAKN